MTTHYYAAYGMNTDPGAMALRTGTPTPIGRGLVRDHAFRFATHADVFPQPGTNTYVVLWELDDHQLAQLDRREGYPTYYDRKKVTVESGGRSWDAWMYFMVDGHPTAPPPDSYYKMITSGYTAFGVPLSQIQIALKESQEVSLGRGGRPTRWFNSYTELVRQHAGRKRLAQIEREASSQGISTEQLCCDYVEYSILSVPNHFQVHGSEFAQI